MSPADPNALRFLDRAWVYKSSRRAAQLIRERAGVRFEYFSDYLDEPDARPVATTLPLGEVPVRTGAPGAVPPFFAGLLPEGRRLASLRRSVKTSADDDLTLLLAVGEDTIGDVQIVEAGEVPSASPSTTTTADWSRLRFADLYAEVTGELLAPAHAAIPGVQVKVSAQVISLPIARAHERYLLKLDPPEYPHLVANEALFLAAARESGLSAASAEIVTDADGRAGLLVRRFDRVAADPAASGPDAGGPGAGSGPHMLAQEDACQVLGRYPADKYSLGAEVVVRGLAGVTAAPSVAAREFVRQLAFAYLTGNGDAHAKNLSVLQQPDGEWRPSPAYDVSSSSPYGDHTMALPIDGKTDDRIGLADFVALGEAVGVRARATERAVAELTGRVEGWLPRLNELPFDDRAVHRLRRAICFRRDHLSPHRS